MATRKRGDKCGLRIEALRIAKIGRRSRGLHLDPVVEAPDVIAVVSLVAKIGAIARPFNGGSPLARAGTD